jgi:Ribbon-helix-helix protein, copG family
MSQVTYPLGMPKELLKEVKHAAKETGLSVADVMRQAIKFGVPRVRQALSREEDFAEAAAESWGPAPEILWDKLPKDA